MKVRLGFVSNSSSCSFTCPCCNHTQFGWDWEEDPVCNDCGVHMNNVSETFIGYLATKYKFDEVYERMMFRKKQDRIQKEDDLDEKIESVFR